MWRSLATLDVSDEWTYLPTTTANYIRLKSQSTFDYGKGYLARYWRTDDRGEELFDIKTIYAAPEATIVKLEPIFLAGYEEAGLVIRRDRRQSFQWNLQVEHDPDAQTDAEIDPDLVTTVATSTVTASATPVRIKSSATTEKGFAIKNNSNRILYLKLGLYTKLANGSYPAQSVLIPESNIEVPANTFWTMPFRYGGRIEGFWAGVNGNATISLFS
jgi:hypothetical protein